jgi:hypothetical protein
MVVVEITARASAVIIIAVIDSSHPWWQNI